MLPVSLDRAAESLFERIYAKTAGNSSLPTHDRDRQIIAHERFRALFRGPIEDMHIYYFEGFRGDLGAALARFPDLRRLTVIGGEQQTPTEAEWTLFCTRLRKLENLVEIELGGEWITDAALAPLRGHPRLRKLAITYGRLTAECTETFRSLPQLSSLHLEDIVYSEETFYNDRWLSPEKRSAMKAALPDVAIDIENEVLPDPSAH